MELSEQLQAGITEIFRNVQYGRISFYLSPEKKTLDYSVKTTGRLPIHQDKRAFDQHAPLEKQLKSF